jgi:O-acetyl-ADP-ribose deacetylase (regulator of RNase III)
MKEIRIGGKTLALVQGDITEERTSAIVNAANNALRGGGGVDGAIHRKGGPKIMEECRRIRWCDTGKAVITTGGNLPARYVIHTVGPVYRDGKHGEPELLASCYRSSMELARRYGIRSLAFPAISTGAYGYPLSEAGRIALKTILEELENHPGIELVRVVLFDERSYRIYSEVLEELLKEKGLEAKE